MQILHNTGMVRKTKHPTGKAFIVMSFDELSIAAKNSWIPQALLWFAIARVRLTSAFPA